MEIMGSQELPPEMIFEILSRSSLETLDRCKAVSKHWKHMIYEPTFLPLHCQRSGCVFGYFFQAMKDNKDSSTLVSGCGEKLKVDEMKMTILDSSDQGLLCCEKRTRQYNNHRYYVCKPVTNQWQGLPNPKRRYRTTVVAIVVSKSTPLCYTIVRLSEHRQGIRYNCEVFDSQTWVWSKTEDPVLPEDDFIVTGESSVSIGQTVYWFTYKRNVLSLDTKSHCFRCFPSPKLEGECNKGKQLVKYEGGLGFSCTNEDGSKLELWVLHNLNWTKKMAVDMSVPLETLPYHRIVDFCSSDVVFITTYECAAFYNIKDGSLDRVKVPGLMYAPQIFRFRSNLETVDLKPSM